MLFKKEVQHIAKLARLGITENEDERFAKELSSILNYFQKLKEADVSIIEPASRSLKVENVMRKDEIKSQKSNIRSQKLIELAPETKDGYLKVKSIFR